MSLRNTSASFGSISKTFHWVTALLILTLIPLGFIATDMAHALQDPSIPSTNDDILRTVFLFSLHKTIGVALFFVALARIFWTLSQPKPGLLNADKPAESLLAETVHWLLYGSLVLVPLTGWIHHAATTGFAPIWWPFGQSLPLVPRNQTLATLTSGLHLVLGRVLILALALHILGALKHHVIDKDATLRRMLPGRSDAPQVHAQPHALIPPLAALLIWGVALTIGASIGALGTLSAPTNTTAQSETQSGWQITDGTLAIDIRQLGNTVSGTFSDWTAAITFDDPDGPGPAGTVAVSINVASLTLGSVTDQAMGPDFFDTETYPTVTFKGQITQTETGYLATGPLTIRDTEMQITLPFDLDVIDATATMSASLDLNRLDYDIGTSVPDENTLGLTVRVTIDLTATRTP